VLKTATLEAHEPTRKSVLDLPTLVLNRSWTPVHIASVRRAICMVYQAAAEVVATETLSTHPFEEWISMPEPKTSRWIRTATMAVPAPEVIRLNVYDRVPSHEAPFTRRNLYQRDNYTCQYCGRRTSADKLSVDHVLPRSKGGRTCWENCVLACVRCNARKADRTLKEAGLRLLQPPRRPRWSPYLNMSHLERLPSWRRFTPDDLWDIGDATQATGT
jgi:5-methylcytosine-specific restriction endonuclease McrA